MDEKDEWETVEVSSDDVPYEIEEEEEVTESAPTPEPEEVASKQTEEAPTELEGINTRGAEKRIRQLIRQRKERDEQIQQLMQSNEDLTNTLLEKNQEVNSIAKQSLDASEKQLTDKMDLARSVYMEAFEEGDKEKVLKAQEMLNDAQSDLKTVHMYRANNEEQEEEEYYSEPIEESFVPAPVYDPRARDWAEDNEWFGADHVMTAAALAIDNQLKEEGYNPNDQEFYQEIDSRIKEAFPQKFGKVQERAQENTTEPAQVVSGASRSSPNSSKKVKLSKEDIRLAQKWGIPLEYYAAEKLKVSKADGEYTNIN
jgi:hypothetical protein